VTAKRATQLLVALDTKGQYRIDVKTDAPHESLFWRFWNQAAVRSGRWKYLQAGNAGEFLFDLSTDEGERRNLIKAHPEMAHRLRSEVAAWAKQMKPPGLPNRALNEQEAPWYEQ
jgi:arylsulfatase A-like enzyme